MCGCGLCVFKHLERAHFVIRRPRRAHMPHAYLHMNLKCANQQRLKEIRLWAIKNWNKNGKRDTQSSISLQSTFLLLTICLKWANAVKIWKIIKRVGGFFSWWLLRMCLSTHNEPWKTGLSQCNVILNGTDYFYSSHPNLTPSITNCHISAWFSL